MATATAVNVTGLTKVYGTTHALAGISFAVRSGEVFGMLGPNGAGKTTCIECIEGLREPDAGLIEVLEMQQGPDRHMIKAHIGVQLQTTGLYPRLTVRELLKLFARFYPKPLSVSGLIDLVGLQEKSGTLSKDLSGGQKQRLSLALALIGNPGVVFLDEPTTGLDPQARRAVWDIISDLKRDGKTVLLTTHYMEEAEQLCDRVAVIDHGTIIETGSPSDLISRHFGETAIEFPGSSGWQAEELSRLPGVARSLVQAERVVLYASDVPRAMAGLFDLAGKMSLSLSEIRVRSASLEDVFLKLTGRSIRQ